MQFHFDADSYLSEIRRELPVYEQIQQAVARAASGQPARRILDLGAGTGETTRAVLQHHPTASVVLFDENPGMLAAATRRVGDGPIEEIVVGDLLGSLPDGPFDLIVSALAIHHLEGAAKRDLFFGLRPLLRPGGRFVMADVIVPVDPADAVTPLSEDYDHPSPLRDVACWLRDAGFDVSETWRWNDIVVLSCATKGPAASLS